MEPFEGTQGTREIPANLLCMQFNSRRRSGVSDDFLWFNVIYPWFGCKIDMVPGPKRLKYTQKYTRI